MGPARVIGTAFYGDALMPTVTDTQDIGSSSIKWKNIYARTFHGALNGNASTATSANIASSQYGVAYYGNTSGEFAGTAQGAANTALMGKGNAAPGFVSVSPGITITAGTASDAPKVNVTVLGISGTAQSITKATTGLWGVTKLSNTSSTSEEGLAATPKGVWAAIGNLAFNSPTASGTEIAFIDTVSQVNGTISATKKTVRDASASQSGVVSTGAQTFAGNKSFTGVTTFNNNTTTTGVATFNGNVAMNSAVSADSLTAGSLIVSGNTSLVNTTNAGTILPHSNNSYNLGASGNRFAKLFVGGADTYGAQGLPVYWNVGVPVATYPIQYTTWTIASGATSVTLTKSGYYFADTYVIALVVTSGDSYLNGPITWASTANTLTLTTSAATSGAVSGYVITARGASI